ncbi:aldose 1-epimerase [Streptomyces gobiensis]|uniref:aldose epimerase family protein n=1 Tax=Streptomyces gobiensis TaxID=2875706 RepID=UPI001E2E191F|nr:aldose 1-epimerase [Streptomyces gobiensis]UGY92714.1 aldose 1-epimerase [Streptomyces gobiensis]
MTTHTTQVHLAAAETELTIEPAHGCRIASLKVRGTELLRQGEKYGSFVMVPWCGRTDRGRVVNGGETYHLPVTDGPHAMHGLARAAAWQTVRMNERSAAFTYELGMADPWPWPGTVTQVIEVAEDGGGVTLALGVETIGDSFPAQVGWHPWFLRNLGQGGQDVRIDFSPEWQEERGDDELPTGRRIDPRPGPWDDCFGMPDGVDVTLTWPGELELKVVSRSAEWVVIYDKQETAVCVEPQSGPPNGLNTDPRLVTPIEPLEIATTWSWKVLA